MLLWCPNVPAIYLEQLWSGDNLANAGALNRVAQLQAGRVAVARQTSAFGAEIFFIIIFLLMITLAFYAGYRMTQRATVADTAAYAAVLPNSTGVAVEIAQEYAFDIANEDDEKSDA